MTPCYTKLEGYLKDKDELPSSRAKPSTDINHALNIELLWRTSILKAFIQGYKRTCSDWRRIIIQSYTHLDENQEDKLVEFRVLQEGLCTTAHSQLLSTCNAADYCAD